MTADEPKAPATKSTIGSRLGQWWMLPAVTFVVGVLLGAVVLWATTSGDNSPSTASGPTATSSITPAPTVTTTATLSVPRECLKVADDAKAVTDVVTQMVAAARDLDAAKLSDLVRQLQTAQKTVQDDAATCRDAQVSIPSLAPTTS